MAQRLAALGCPRERLAVLHLGVPLDTLPFLPSVWSGSGPLRILIAASFRAKKGIPLALAAAARLRADLPVQVTLVGDAGSEPASQAEKVRVLEAMREHDLGTDLRWLGTLSPRQLRAEARAHHVLLAPSLTAPSGDTEGGLPVTLLEMAALGVAVVTTRHADIPELVQHQVTGLLADEGNVDGLVDGVALAGRHTLRSGRACCWPRGRGSRPPSTRSDKATSSATCTLLSCRRSVAHATEAQGEPNRRFARRPSRMERTNRRSSPSQKGTLKAI